MYGFTKTMFYSACLFLVNFALAKNAQDLLSCGTVAETFAERVGPPDNVPVTPISDATLTECSSTLRHTNMASCCNADMESRFLPASAHYLHDHIQISNSRLKARITQSLHLYQEHLRLSLQEAHNKTSDLLASLYKIPKNVHTDTLNSFIRQLSGYLIGRDELNLTEIIGGFFTNLFPIVFNYVLSDSSNAKHTSDDFDQCLVRSYGELQPFGNVPKHLERMMKYGFQRARIYTEALEVMISSIGATDNLIVHTDCKKALSRLHFCSLCSGEVDVRPCRGLCLNVMRGCLSGISEISTSWDDLIVDFENLHVGMLQQNNAQELLSYLDGNVTDALLQAMDDGPRIFARVTELCRHSSQSKVETGLYKKFFTPEGFILSHPNNRIHSIRNDITALIVQLEESKGFFQRIADGLCRTPAIYDQEMQSDQCWNGSAVGRYMHEVPEANIIAQVKHNMEVRITLIPEPVSLQVKDTLVHMKRNLSILYNEELMQRDQSYKTVVSSGGGYAAGRDVVIDDEDFVDRSSGSGSGYGGVDEDGRGAGEKPTHTTRPISESGRGHGHIPPGSGGTGIGSRPGDGKDKGSRGGPRGSAAAITISLTLLFVCALLTRIHL